MKGAALIISVIIPAGVFGDADDVTEGTQLRLLSRHPGACASHACTNSIALV